jgi:hypothetical protein
MGVKFGVCLSLEKKALGFRKWGLKKNIFPKRKAVMGMWRR